MFDQPTGVSIRCAPRLFLIGAHLCGMAARERSEGELSSSDENAPEIPPPPKQTKLSEAPSDSISDPSSRSAAGNDRTSARKRSKRRKEKEENRKRRKQQQLIQQFRSSPWNSSADQVVSSSCLAEEYLGMEQVRILELLVSLLGHSPPPAPIPATSSPSLAPPSPPPSAPLPSPAPPLTSSNNLTTLKTGKFQRLLLHLLLGVPWLQSPIPRLDELRGRRVVVLWLSMVSADLFLKSTKFFPGTKKLVPCVRFLIEHPGSSQFVRLGLEALMFLSEDGGKQRGRKGEGEGQEKVSRKDCLLDLSDMEKNGFPVPPSPSSAEGDCEKWASYVQLGGSWLDHTPVPREAGSFPMFALDCEMVETAQGLELARISLVNEALECIYDKLVKPENPVIDYKTQFSGITEEMLVGVATSLCDVQTSLCKLLPPQSILVGHSLENDLHTLKMAHPCVIDTSCLFIPQGDPHKPKLRLLSRRLLGAEIQAGSGGHNSVEDATACMKLVQAKLSGATGVGLRVPTRARSILTEVASLGRSVATVDRHSVVSLFGQGTTKRSVSSDRQVVDTASNVISKHDLTFLQFHGYEDHLKGVGGEGGVEGVLGKMDEGVVRVVEGCPGRVLVLVVCGSSDIREVKKLQQTQEIERLKEVVGVARTGLVLALAVD